MGTIRRKDSKNRVLKNGEYERSNHRYEYRWTDSMKKRHSIYADTLPELREKEQYLIRDMYTGVQADSNTLTINDLFEKWKIAEKQKRKPKDRSEIINDAVVTYWMAMQADEYNDPYMQRLEIVFERVFRKYMSGFIRSLNATNILAREAKEYMRLLCKGLNIDRAKDGVERLLYMTLPWDILIPEKVAREMRVKNPELEDEELM